MGFINKLFGNSDKESSKSNEQTFQPESCKTEEDFLEKFGGIVLEKQLDFADLIGENNWNISMDSGTISFGDNLVFPIQVLGTYSHSAQTWLWAWANTQSNISEHLLQQALQLKKYGEDNQMDLLQNSTFDFSVNELHVMGIIAAGFFNDDAYYIADYGQGAMLVSLKDDKIKKARKDHHSRIAFVFPQLISNFEVNHKNAFKAYLTAKGYQITETSNAIIGTKNTDSITGEFDDLSRLTTLKGDITN